MTRVVKLTFVLGLASAVTWVTAWACHDLQTNRSVVSMSLVLEVLIVATFSDWLLAVLTSMVASLAFSWYFVDTVGSLAITTSEGGITWLVMLLTALIGSHLAIRAQHRAREAIDRRYEMERLQQLGEAMLAGYSVNEAAELMVRKIVELFGVGGAALRIDSPLPAFRAGDLSGPRSDLPLRTASMESMLALHGGQPSMEVKNALASLVSLVLDRARGAEERARVEASRKGDEMRTTVLNALAHTFKTPLTSIKAASSMLRDSPQILQPYGRELVAVIDEEADRLSALIRDSLDLVKLEARRENPRTELCYLSDIVHTVTARSSRYLSGRNLVVDVPDDLPGVWGDPFLFEQMLMQVVDNAWKYSTPRAEIRITANARGNQVVLTIQNQGSRIPDDERERIFGKFYRGVTNRFQVEGTGLGLAIARTIAEAHRGSVWLDSEPDGPAFRFSLPVEKNGDDK